MKKTDLSELHAQIEDRIAQMEQEDYEFPRRFSTRDYIITAVVVVVCLALVIGGAYLG